MMVQDPRKPKDVDALFEQARQSAVDRPVEPSSRSASTSFTGAARLLSGETVSSSPQQAQQDQPQVVMHTITFWMNGFTVDDGPLRRFDDPENRAFMESIAKSECPHELEPVDRKIRVHVDLVRREENYTEPPKPKNPFLGVGRTLGASGSGTSSAEPQAPPPQRNTAPAPSRGLVVDPAVPVTSIQLRLADGTRLVSRFNNHHTVRDIRGFIDASRPGGSKEYQLLTMGFPPKQLTELDQTIEQAGIANSVVIQKF
jgi:serine/threonine-protein phosphatase 2A regulatory subunit B'/UBX domain-containing protein 1